MFLNLAIYFFILSTILFGETLKSGNQIKSFSLSDQFDRVHVVNSSNDKKIIIVFDKNDAIKIADFIENQQLNSLRKSKPTIIFDISDIPSLISKMFLIPKIQDYNFPILFIYDNDNPFPRKKESITVIKTKNNSIDEIRFLSNKNDYEKLFD